MRKTTQKTRKVEAWLVRCSQGHEFFTDYLPEIVNEITGDYECPECLAIGETTPVNLTCSHCVEGKHLVCPEADLLECSCKCNEDPEFILQLIAELEIDGGAQ